MLGVKDVLSGIWAGGLTMSLIGWTANYMKKHNVKNAFWYLLNVLILELLVKFCIKNVLISQFVSLFTVSVVTYVLFKYFAFSKK